MKMKINKAGLKTRKVLGTSPVTTAAAPLTTFEGAAAFSRDAKSDLFLLATTNFFGEDTFYEAANVRNDRFIGLVHRVATEDPAWLGAFLPWLRRKANIRTAAVVGAVEAARVLAQADVPGREVGPGRRIIAETLYRADEPAEALAYWLTTYGRKIPAPVRRGIADAATRMYSEHSFIKYDPSTAAVRMADVIELTHPRPHDPTRFDGYHRNQTHLFKHIVDSRHRPTRVPGSLTMLRNREALTGLDPEIKQTVLRQHNVAEVLREAGMTWEQVSSWGAFTAATWEAVIPTMGYMALLRNLRNFQDKGVSDATLKQVAMRLGDREQVRNSRQLPYRFLAAHLAATHPVWSLALETALQYSTANIPALSGSTLVLVDTSGSMQSPVSAMSSMSRVMAGALFGVALASKGEKVDLYGFADRVFSHPVRPNAGVLRQVGAFVRRVGEVGHGTQIAESLKATYKGQGRVVIITDEQTFSGFGNAAWTVGFVGNQIPTDIPIYSFNLAGYAPAMMETSTTRHQLGGLTDQTFRLIPMVEAGINGRWPWEENK